MSLKRWIISRTRSGEVCTSRAITSTVLPPTGGQDHHGPPVSDHVDLALATSSPNDALQLSPLVIRQTPDLHPLAHA